LAGIKRIYFLLIFISLIVPAVMGNSIMGQRWCLPDEFMAHIEFSEQKYDIIFAVGGYFCSGDYIYNGNEVTLFYPEVDKPPFMLGTDALNWLFQNSKQAVFVYDPNYVDFDCVSSLRNGERLLKNMSNPSPYGKIYQLQGYDVIKYNRQESMVLVLDNLRMRESPHMDSRVISLNIHLVGVDESFSTHVVHKNSINYFDAKTVKQDTIDGITAPWYRITIILDETFQKYVWVFGGYLREIARDEIKNEAAMRNYWKKYYETLAGLGIIKKNPIW